MLQHCGLTLKSTWLLPLSHLSQFRRQKRTYPPNAYFYLHLLAF